MRIFTPLAASILLFLASLSFIPLAYSNDYQFSSGNKKVALIELYTSEGCSSCPPAEKWLGNLINDPNLWIQYVPIALHVDYWDYIGWKDPFANPVHGQRQRNYRQQGSIRTVYTPGMILDGSEWQRWRSGKITPSTSTNTGNLIVKVNDDKLNATYTPQNTTVETWNLNVAILGFKLESRVNKGENAGRLLKQEFVVLGYAQSLSSDTNWEIKLPKVNKRHALHTGIAVWVNQAGIQTPVQATGGWLK